MKKNSIPKLELVFLLLLTGMCPQAHATDDGRNASPQKTYAVDLTLGSATVLTFTEAVTSQTGVLFSYESALSQMPLGDVSVHETAAPLEHILEKVFKGRGFRYKVVDRIVVLTYDTDSARSQLVLVTGRVKDGSGMPLVGASVVVKDTMRGVSAGAEGNYRIFADPDATLVFSYIGYADREERIGTRSAIDVVLEEYEAVLEDVVVVGYGTQSRRTVTAAISKFDGHLLEGIPVNSVGDALKGRIPGVRVATTDATPGADPKFLIRGGSSINQSNDPIVLVDGVVREMAGLNPNDIESVSFLKDAAAAGIYGSRASNGVILITTKKGSKHLGPRIVFEGQWAWASPATKFDLMNARDYILTVRPALMEGYCGGMDPASVLGGEQSGHLIFRNYSTTGDGLLAALQVLRIMRERGKPLSELADQLQLYPQRLISVPVQRKPPLEECSEIREAVRAAEAELAEPDKRGRVLLRYSGTENVCRVMVESSREDVVQRLARDLSNVVRRVLG